MKLQELLEKTKGYSTVASLQQQLGVTRQQAVYLIHRLRKKGYVRTRYLQNKTRSYYIAPENAIGGTSYVKVMNIHAPHGLRLMPEETFKIYGKTITPEETLIYALKQQKVRFVLASLGLFRVIHDWSALYRYAKKENLVRPIATLHEIARKVIPKISRLPKRFENRARPRKNDPFISLVPSLSSDCFQNIEKKWRVYLPINKADFRDLQSEFAYERAQKHRRIHQGAESR